VVLPLLAGSVFSFLDQFSGRKKMCNFLHKNKVTSIIVKKQHIWNNKVSLIIFERIACVF